MEAYLDGPSRRTSADLNWDQLVVRSRVESPQKEYLFIPGTPDPWLVLMVGGAPRFEVRDGPRWRAGDLRPGHVCLTSPGRLTEVRWQSAAPFETVHICLNVGLFHRYAVETADCDPARVEVIDALTATDPLIEHVGLVLKRELESPASASRLLTDTAAQFLTAHLLRRHCAFPIRVDPPGGSLPAYQLRRVREYVEAHISSPITLDELAGLVDVSRYHFARMFKRTTRETPHAFVTRLRIERAKRLLCGGDWPIAAVARASGFVSPSHFAALFRRHTGTTPHVFRSGRS